jgi:hypothetical protein
MVFSCLNCNASFKCNSDFERHLNRKNPCLNKEEKAKRNDCPYCDKTFYGLSNKVRHLKTCPKLPKINNDITHREEIVTLREENMNLREENIRLREQPKVIKNTTNNRNTTNNNTTNNNTTINNNSDIRYGYIYVRDNDSYKRDNVYKIGVTRNLFKRNNQYKTGEFTQSEYVYLIKIRFNELYVVDIKMKKLMIPYNIRDNAGTEFYHRNVMEDIVELIHSLNVEYEIIEDSEEIKNEVKMNECIIK